MALLTHGLKTPYSCVPSSLSSDLSFSDTHLHIVRGPTVSQLLSPDGPLAIHHVSVLVRR